MCIFSKPVKQVGTAQSKTAPVQVNYSISDATGPMQHGSTFLGLQCTLPVRVVYKYVYK